MEHGLELIIARLEILEIEVCNISYKPRDIGNLSFSTSSYPGNIGKWIFLISHILEILDRTIHTQSYPGNSGSYDPYISPILEIVDRTIQYLLIILKTFFDGDGRADRRACCFFSLLFFQPLVLIVFSASCFISLPVTLSSKLLFRLLFDASKD